MGRERGHPSNRAGSCSVAREPDAVLVNTPAGLRALRQITSQTPIAFVQYAAQGVIRSLAPPGGDTTGFAILDDTLDHKWLEFLKEIAPETRRVAFIQNPEHPSWERYTRSITAAAPKLGMQTFPVAARDEVEVERAIAEFSREPNGGLVVLPATFNTTHRKVIIAQAAQHRLPAIYPNRFYAVDGGLISYGGDLPDLMYRAATYVDRILRRKPRRLARPADHEA